MTKAKEQIDSKLPAMEHLISEFNSTVERMSKEAD
jgi:hypothetical protein